MSTPEVHVRRYGHGSRVPGWDVPVDLDKDPAIVPDPATTAVPAELRATIEGFMARYPDRRSAAIPALWAAQLTHGWCSPEAIRQVACVMTLTPAYLAQLVGFYDMFEEHPVGRHQVYVCTNISCSLRGADALHQAFREAAEGDANFNIRGFECLGACDIAPMASVNGDYLGPLELSDAERVVRALQDGGEPPPGLRLGDRPNAGLTLEAQRAGDPGRGTRPSGGGDQPDRSDQGDPSGGASASAAAGSDASSGQRNPAPDESPDAPDDPGTTGQPANPKI